MDDISSQYTKLNKFPFFTIYEWMIEDLGLTGNTLVIFAYIYRQLLTIN